MSSMWMVQDDDGRYLNWDEGEGQYEFSSFFEGQAFLKSREEDMASAYGGHLVEMVPAKPKVPVSQEEADMLEGITNALDDSPAGKIANYVDVHSHNKWAQDELRLMQAYVNGYTVVEPTKYNVKVPHMQTLVYCRDGEGGLVVTDVDTINGAKFTLEQIKAYKLQDCERVEIDTEDSENE